MVIGERLQERIDAAGMDQSKLARRVGLNQSTINALVKGDQQTSKKIDKIAEALGTSKAYLEGETDDPTAVSAPPPTREQMAQLLDLVPIVEIDQDYGMGGTFTADYVEETIQHFPRIWLEGITLSPPSMLTVARGKGDSMDPTIRDRDMVIIDRSRRVLDEQDAIWALTVGQIGMIKRLRARGEHIVIASDNKQVSDEVVHNEEVHIVGRVIFVGRRT